jgi:hypothetical protein
LTGKRRRPEGRPLSLHDDPESTPVADSPLAPALSAQLKALRQRALAKSKATAAVADVKEEFPCWVEVLPRIIIGFEVLTALGCVAIAMARWASPNELPGPGAVFALRVLAPASNSASTPAQALVCVARTRAVTVNPQASLRMYSIRAAKLPAWSACASDSTVPEAIPRARGRSSGAMHRYAGTVSVSAPAAGRGVTSSQLVPVVACR